MAASFETEFFSQNSIYNKSNGANHKDRKVKVYYSTPARGVNETTGFLLLIAGFGGQSTSNVYKKMRDMFSDEYNLVTIQCDYFGYEFMQYEDQILYRENDVYNLCKTFSEEDINKIYKSGKLDFNAFINEGSNYDVKLQVYADLSKESLDNFNDMGLMQSIDNIGAVLSVMKLLKDKNMNFNIRKVIAYGHSHGAYLSYLCNALAPHLFSLIIDNSAWLFPAYFSANRLLIEKINKLELMVTFDYLAKRVIDDTEILRLPFLYSKFNNSCKIISYHGTDDNLISCKEKAAFLSNVSNCVYNEISKENVDNIIFKSNKHGLDADFIELFILTMNKLDFEFSKGDLINLDKDVIFVTEKNKYVVNYKNTMPQIYISEL